MSAAAGRSAKNRFISPVQLKINVSHNLRAILNHFVTYTTQLIVRLYTAIMNRVCFAMRIWWNFTRSHQLSLDAATIDGYTIHAWKNWPIAKKMILFARLAEMPMISEHKCNRTVFIFQSGEYLLLFLHNI